MIHLSWKEKYKLLKEFCDINGHLVVPNDYVVDGIELGKWFHHYRINKSVIPENHRKDLDSLGMIWDSFEYNWFIRYYEAKKYYEANGHLNVSMEERRLYNWIIKQRQSKKDNKLSQKQIDLLDAIEMPWGKGASKDIWMKNYNILKEYYEIYKSYDFTGDYSYKGLFLLSWIRRQRYYKDSFSLEQKKLLDAIDFPWKSSLLSWAESYELAKKFYEDHHHLLIPVNYTIDGYNIRNWILNQRRKYHKNLLSEDKIKLLNEIEMVWDKPEEEWQQKYNLAKDYSEKYGNLNIPCGYTVDKVNLYSWIGTQRTNYNQGKLSEKRIRLLVEIGMDLTDNKNRNEIRWERNYELAKAYYEKYGDLLIHRDYVVDGVKLGSWLNFLRTHKDSLSQEKIERLEAIGMQWKLIDYERKTFDESFAIAKRYYETYGNLLIEENTIFEDYNLSNWLVNMKNNYRQNKLTIEQIKKLESIEIIWDMKKYKAQKKWEAAYEQAKEYYKNNGDWHNIDNPKIKNWVNAQKNNYNKAKLNFKKIKLLDQIGLSSYLVNHAWLKTYKRIEEYYNKHKRIITIVDPELIEWIEKQRERYESNLMSPLEIKLLNKIGMIWNLEKCEEYQQKITKYNLLQIRKDLEETLNNILDTHNQYKKIDNNDIEEIEEELLRKLY